MTGQRTIVLDHPRVQRKLRRIAYQLVEEHQNATELVLIGVAPRGARLAERLQVLLAEIVPLPTRVLHISLDKNAPLEHPVALNAELDTLRDQRVVLVDDVLMSGRTLMHAAAYLVQVPMAHFSTVVLVDRLHRAYPIRADIVGLTLTTTVQEHISVELGAEDAVYLS